ncbi:hypothetical protein [Methylomonas sp. MgM2]
MKKTKLARSISLIVAGGVLSFGGMPSALAISTTMYNLSTGDGEDNSANNTDWTTNLGSGTDGWANGASWGNRAVGSVANQKWAGTGGETATPFGYAGAHLNWAVEFTGGVSNVAEISTFDSFNRYGVYADVDTARGAWSDNAVTGAAGWLHDTDTGLFRSDVSGTVTLNIESVLQSGTNFGYTIFKGMDAVTKYYHHASWNPNSNENGIIAPDSSPYEAGGLMPGTILPVSDIVAYSVGGANPSNLNTITFDAEAGQIYTIFLGGYRNGSWQTSGDAYRLTVSQTPVPVPAAAWLFGGALATLVGRLRRKIGLSRN